MSAVELRPGHIVAGRFTVQSVLRQGGGASTFEVIAAPNRALALRVYETAVGALPQAVADLQRYELMTNALPDNRVMHVVESGQDPQTQSLYSATELSPHPSLAQLVELCPLSPIEMAAVLTNLGRAMDLAHEAGAFHLGLKPTNVFVGPAPSYDVKVADFGTALVRKVLSEDARGYHAAWLAPEQLPLAGSFGAETDVFAAALVAFFGMTSRSYWRSCRTKPFDGSRWKDELSAPPGSVVERAAELGVSLPAALDAVYARALAKDPSSRFPTVGQFAAAFRDAAGAIDATELPAPASEVVPSIAPPPTNGSSTKSAPSLLAYGIGAASVLAIAGIFWGTARLSRVPRVPEHAVLASATAIASPEPEPLGRSPEPAPPEPAAVSPDPIPAPGDSSPEPTPPLSPADSTTPAAVAPPVPNTIVVTCSPACDAIYIDGKRLKQFHAPIAAAPGKHMITGMSGVLRAQHRLVRVTAGEQTTLEIEFPPPPEAKPAKPTPSPRPAAHPAKKPCGKFLKRCD